MVLVPTEGAEGELFSCAGSSSGRCPSPSGGKLGVYSSTPKSSASASKTGAWISSFSSGATSSGGSPSLPLWILVREVVQEVLKGLLVDLPSLCAIGRPELLFGDKDELAT